MSASDAVRAREQGKRPDRPAPAPRVATFSKTKPKAVIVEAPVEVKKAPKPIVVEPEPVEVEEAIEEPSDPDA